MAHDQQDVHGRPVWMAVMHLQRRLDYPIFFCLDCLGLFALPFSLPPLVLLIFFGISMPNDKVTDRIEQEQGLIFGFDDLSIHCLFCQ